MGPDLPDRRFPAVAALVAALALLIAGCGGGSSDGTMSKDEVVAQVETACTKLSGYSVWLPEYLQKSGKTFTQGKAIVDGAAAEFRSTLNSLDPPADLKGPIEQLAAPEGTPKTRAELTANVKQHQSLYDQIGADRCSRSLEASILNLDGASVEDAYRKVGLPLPPHPEGW